MIKLAVVFTGGTIGSRVSGGMISPDEERNYELLADLDRKKVEVSVFAPYTILSEQLSGKYINMLIACVDELLKKDFDGIIVTHGTDTLQYSAAALHLAYANSKIPIVLVSANYILTDPRSNGRDNFKFALRFVEEHIGGVFVSYRNTGEKPAIFPANTLLPFAPYSDYLSSLGGAYGYFEGERFINLMGELGGFDCEPYTLSENSPVLWLRAHPGMSFPDLSGNKAVLFESYHSGTLPTKDEKFAEFCRKTEAKKFVVGVEERIQYESTSRYELLDIVELPPISPIYAYMMLWKRYSSDT